MLTVLKGVLHPTPQRLRAVVYLARTPGELPELVALANTEPEVVCDAATVKSERGGGH